MADSALEAVIRDGERAWAGFSAAENAWQVFVHTDYRAAAAVLRRLRSGAETFLECGSGVGVVTVLAGLLGFDAYGIEVDPRLHAASLDLAARHHPAATFALGSFLPDDLRDDVSAADADVLAIRDGEPAYAALGMELRDFDLVYAFPWPGEEERFHHLLQRHGRADAILLTYSATEGFRGYRGGDPTDPVHYP